MNNVMKGSADLDTLVSSLTAVYFSYLYQTLTQRSIELLPEFDYTKTRAKEYCGILFGHKGCPADEV